MYVSAAVSRQKNWYFGERLIKGTGICTNMIEQIGIPEKVERILNTLTEHGYEAFTVGGCVRDSLLGRKPKDWDITTSAKPLQVKELFSHTVDTGLAHGTVTVIMGREGFEVTTYRIDGEYTDSRHPKEVSFTPNLREDLMRRDFTINAMAYNPRAGLIDQFGGVQDLQKGIIRCVGNPQNRFMEDALRMLRAVRFAAQLNFDVAEQTKDAVRELAGNLQKISAERIAAELVQLLVSGHPQRIRDAYFLGITRVILPEFDRIMETGQNNPHHCFSVGEHTIHAMQYAGKDKILQLSLLFHDMGKPDCKSTDQNGIDHFYGHPQKGEVIARQVLKRLKFDTDTLRHVCALVRWHDDNPVLKEEKVRRAVRKIGTEQYPALFDVKRADILAQSEYKRQDKLAYIDDYEKLYQEIIKRRDCLEVKQLAVTGRDVMALGIPQGKQVGDVLNKLLELTLDDPAKNERQYLLEQAKKLWK